MNWRFSEKFRSQWIKVKFYEKTPEFLEEKDILPSESRVEKLKNVRFCEATKEALTRPIILDKESISCPGARYCFGWGSDVKKAFLDTCQDKRKIRTKIIKSMLSEIPYLKKPFEYIGLNTNDDPDLLVSYMAPEEIMRLIKIYHNRKGQGLGVFLHSMMSICGGIAVRSFLENNLTISFGCDDSRYYADMRRENLVVGIPKGLFGLFLEDS